MSLSEPPKVPIAVRTGSAKTTDRCDVMTILLKELQVRDNGLRHYLF
jgi:hypothetical protein